MKTVISASRRTDIPAHYLNWFMDKIREGKVNVQNPFYKKNISKVDLSPEFVGWIVFWSRNYTKFLINRSFFNEYRLFFHFTILSHHPFLEKVKLIQSKTMKQMEDLVKYYGSDHILWRYDPIVCWEDCGKIETNYNEKDFEFYCQEFSALGLKRCYFSYVTDYAKFQNRFKKKFPNLKILSGDNAEISPIIEEMRKISADFAIKLFSCCNDELLGYNTEKGSCISGSLLNALAGEKLVSDAKTPTRDDCGCTRSIDIGDYLKHPCHFGCIYCYANPVWE
jgi:hypothetical protein